MPPLNPPPQCEKHMERRADDTLDVVKKRLQVSGCKKWQAAACISFEPQLLFLVKFRNVVA